MPATLAESGLGKLVHRRGSWSTRYYGVTAGQSFVVGDPVLLDSSGTLIVGAAPSANIDASTDKIVGIALANAADILAGTAPFNRCPVACPDDQSAHFLVPVYHATPATAVLAESAIDAPTVLPIGNVGGVWVLDIAGDGTDDCAVVVERHPKYPHGEQYGWYWAQFQQQALLFGSAYAQT